MRFAFATLVGLFGLLAGFCIPWALLVLPVPGDDSKSLHLLGVTVWFGIYMMPTTLVGFLVVGWPLERLARQTPERFTRYGMRIASWMLTSLLYAIFVSMGTSEYMVGSLLCSLSGAMVASTASLFIAGDRHQLEEEPLKASSQNR